MKQYIIKKGIEVCNIKPCSCGSYPDFIIPNMHYTDCWLQCPSCKKQTHNGGGYQFAEIIPLVEAQLTAVNWWNNNSFYTP